MTDERDSIQSLEGMVKETVAFTKGLAINKDSADRGVIFILEQLEKIAEKIDAIETNGDYIETAFAGIPPEKRHYMRTFASVDSLLKSKDIYLAGELNIPDEEADRIVLMNEHNDIVAMRQVADALDITLDELFWLLYSVITREES